MNATAPAPAPVNAADHKKLAWRIVTHYFPGGPADASARGMSWDDVEGIAMLAMVKASRAFDPSRGFRFSTLAWRCLRNDLWTAMRTAKRHARVGRLTDEQAERVPDPASVERPEDPRLPAAVAALEALPPRLREVLRLRHEGGLTLQDVGDRMGLSRERVRQLEWRARGRLRERLGVTRA